MWVRVYSRQDNENIQGEIWQGCRRPQDGEKPPQVFSVFPSCLIREKAQSISQTPSRTLSLDEFGREKLA